MEILSIFCPKTKMPIPGDDRVYVARNVLKLNRVSLVERRTERIMSVEALLNSWAKEQNTIMKDILEQ